MNRRKRLAELEKESTWLWNKIIETDQRYIESLRLGAERKTSLLAAEALLRRIAAAEVSVDLDDDTKRWVALDEATYDDLDTWT